MLLKLLPAYPCPSSTEGREEGRASDHTVRAPGRERAGSGTPREVLTRGRGAGKGLAEANARAQLQRRGGHVAPARYYERRLSHCSGERHHTRAPLLVPDAFVDLPRVSLRVWVRVCNCWGSIVRGAG